MADQNVTIEVNHIYKDFRVYKDKSHTFKDRVLFARRNAYTLNHVLKDVSFEVHRGETIGLIGHNGCGKSTTLKLLNRIIYPDKGSIVMHGKISSLIELGAGFHPDMTGRENIYINATIFGLKRKEIDARLEDIIRFSELEEFIDNPVRTYSSGMYMRLAFAIAINVDADILLVDEILAVGDANFQKKCFDKLAEIKRQGCTIVIVSHSMDQIKSICDNVLWIDHGEIREQGDAVTVCNNYLFEMENLAERRIRQELIAQGKNPAEAPDILYPPLRTAPQAGEYARRMGDMQVRFERVTLCDDTGRLCTQFRYNSPMEIPYELTDDRVPRKGEQMSAVHVIFRIFRNEDGGLCAAFDSADACREDTHRGSCRNGKFRIPSLHLAQGRYIIDAAIEGRDGQVYDCLLHLIEFNVSCDARYGTGVAAMQNEWVYED